ALRDLPRVDVERVAILPDQKDAVFRIARQDAYRAVLEVHDAVDARFAVGPLHVVVLQGDPVVLVHDGSLETLPGVRVHGLVSRDAPESNHQATEREIETSLLPSLAGEMRRQQRVFRSVRRAPLAHALPKQCTSRRSRSARSSSVFFGRGRTVSYPEQPRV